MRKIRIDIDRRRNGIRFSLAGARLFKEGGFDLTYSFDTALSERGALSMAIGLLAPIIARKVPGEVEVALPEPIPDRDMQAWRSYHKLPARVHISTRSDGSYPPKIPRSQQADSPIGLLYGGGKDSVAALTLAETLYPSHPRHILRLNWNATSPERHREAFEQHVLPRLRPHTKFDYFSVTSTMHAELLDRSDAAAVHLARYLCSFIPYLEAQRPRFLCHGYDALEFHGSTYRRAHPQILRQVDTIYAALGIPTTLRSLCFALPPKIAFGMARRLKPGLVSAIYMCESLDSRWCYKCRKCFTYGILCLANRIEVDGFQFERMFSRDNPYIERIVKHLARPDSTELAELLAYPAHFQATSGWGPDVIQGAKELGLPAASTSVLEALFEAIQHHARPHMDKLWIQAAAYEGGPEFARALLSMAEQHGIPVLDSMGADGTVKGKDVRYLMSDIE